MKDSKRKNRGIFFDLIKGDCLIENEYIKDGSVDLILTDLPYGTTACKWDSVIPFDLMWEQLNRIIKPNGAIVLFGSEPFSSALRMSNINNYKYDWTWVKNIPTGFQFCKKQPMRVVENLLVFYKKPPMYNPQLRDKTIKDIKKLGNNVRVKAFNSEHYTTKEQGKHEHRTIPFDKCYPINSLYFKNTHNNKNTVHPTQKPVALMEYLIKTYTNENETVLDFTMGSGSTGVACKNTNRNFIGIEKDENYFNIAVERIKGTEPTPNNFFKVEERGLFSFTDEQDKLD